MSITREFRREEIYTLVAANELNSATKRLMDFVTDFATGRGHKREVTGLRREYNALRQEIRTLGESDNTRRELRRLSDRILSSLEDILEETSCKTLRPHSEMAVSEAINTDVYLESDGSTHELLPMQTKPSRTSIYKNAVYSQSVKIRESNSPTAYDEATKFNTVAPFRKETITVLKGSNLTKEYRSRTIDFKLHPINVHLNLGEITAIVGENGNGKSTLLKMLSRTLSHSGGEISYPYFESRNRLSSYSIMQKIAYIPQELSAWQGLLIDNLYFSGSINGLKGKHIVEEVEFLIARLGLDIYRNATWEEISGGFRMRFSLAKALLAKPNILVLDEPLANLDINTQSIVLQDLRNLASSEANPLSVVISSQHLHEVESIADQIIFLKDGIALYNGALASFGSDRTENVYEIKCDMPKEHLLDVLDSISYRDVTTIGDQSVIYTSTEVSGKQLIEVLMLHDVELKYFRDISCSTRKLFDK